MSTNREAFNRYLDTEEYHERVERDKSSVQECITTIKASGGRVPLAHPYQIGIGEDRLDKLVGELFSCGLDAIECYYPQYTPEQQEFYCHLVEKYRLNKTGGSDFHGEKVKPDIELARWSIGLEWLMDIKE